MPRDTAKIFTDNSNVTWSISAYGMNRFNKNSKTFYPWIHNPYNNAPNLHLHSCYSQDADGNIWQGNERGSLVKCDLAQRKVADYSWLVATINATLVYCIYKDNNNNIWVGTDNGIVKISNRSAVFNNIPFIVGGKELKEHSLPADHDRPEQYLVCSNRKLWVAEKNAYKAWHQIQPLHYLTFGATLFQIFHFVIIRYI